MAGFCINCVMYTSVSGTIVLILFGIFTFANFEYFELMADELKDNGPFKSKKAKLGAEFMIAGGIYLLLSAYLIWYTNRTTKQDVEDEAMIERTNEIRRTIAKIESEETRKAFLGETSNKVEQTAPLFPNDPSLGEADTENLAQGKKSELAEKKEDGSNNDKEKTPAIISEEN